MEPRFFITDPFTDAELVQNDRFYLNLLHDVLKVGAQLAADLPAQARDQTAPKFDPADAFDRISRAIRRTILLARSLSEPPLTTRRPAALRAQPAAPTAAPRAPRPADEHPRPDRAESLDRLDRLDALDDISGPLPEVIAEITRDLGVPTPWMPTDALAVAPDASAPGATHPPLHRPYRNPASAPPQAAPPKDDQRARHSAPPALDQAPALLHAPPDG